MLGVSGAFRPLSLAGALVLGLFVELGLVLLSMQVGYIVAGWTGNCRACYWASVGAYFGLGFAVPLVVIRWTTAAVRGCVASLVWASFVAFAMARHGPY